jgi:DNA modification methylase
VKLSIIRSNENNPRIIKDDKFDKLKNSIKDFEKMMELRPIIIDEDNVILGGNMRFKALNALGYKDVPDTWVKQATGLTEDEKRRFIIEDNVGFGEWDWDMLANEWDAESLEAWGLDLPFSAEEEQEIKEDVAPTLTENPLSKLGEVYMLGEHRVMCGDSTNPGDVQTLMDGAEADMVFTDPPYGVSYTGVAGSDKWEMINNDDLRGDGLLNFLVAAFRNINDVTKPDTGLYCWFSSKNHVQFENALTEAGWDVKEELIWNKGMSLSGADYQYAHEPVLYCQKHGMKAKWFGGRDKKTILRERRTDLTKLSKATLLNMVANMAKEGTVWEVDRDSVTTYQHPTQKPAKLAARAIYNSSEEKDIVLDLFMGSGSTLSACEQTYRKCYGMELDPKYVDVIRRRYWKLINEDIEDGWEEGTPAINKELTEKNNVKSKS